ncbi:MAG: hypothetical protein IKY78_00830 [Clostridia bacterium]|nr:hypothetical protein [Clostridia bacterium]
MVKKMDKILKVVGTIGVAFLIFSIILAAVGFCVNSENIFYAGLTFLIFGCPVYFVLWLVIFLFAVIIEEKAKKKRGNRDEG